LLMREDEGVLISGLYLEFGIISIFSTICNALR